jgi:cytochrome P450
MTRPLPSITAKKPFDGRAEIQKALCRWYSARKYSNLDVSSVVRTRIQAGQKWGLADRDIAITELGMLFVSTANAIPTLFWLLTYVLADPKLVDEIRKELSAVMSKHGEEMVINITRFPQDTPLLQSAYQETMRLTNKQTGTRIVLADTVLNHISKYGTTTP